MARGKGKPNTDALKKAQKAAKESRERLENQFREDTREKFFQGREDVSDDRLDRRRQQDLAEQRFIRTKMKPVGNTGGTLLQKRDPLGMSLEDFRIQNAMKYGPTPSEVFGDIGRGLSSMAKGYGIPFVSSIMRGVDAVKSGVEAAWDAVRGESTSAQGTAFPQPGSDTKDLFSSIDTGIAEVDPNNMLANIARQNQYEDIPFDQLLSNATAQNLNIPKTIQEVVTDVGLSPVVTVDTPLGKVNVNRLTGDLVTGGNVGNLNYVLQGNPLSEGYGANLNYGLGQGLGIEAAMGSGMTSPDVGLGYDGALPYGNYGIGLGTNLGTGDSSLKGQLGFRPVEYLFGPTAFNPTVSLGAQMSPSQNFEPQLSLNFGYKDGGSVNKNSGLGYMFK
jgi:hypothetical protein